MKRTFSLFFVMLMALILAPQSWAGKDRDACWNFKKAGDYQRAIASGKRAVKAEPRNAVSYFCLGDAYYMSGELKQALPELQRAERLATGKSDLMYIYNKIGMILDKMGNSEQALQQYDRALTLARESGNNDMEASALSNVAGIYQGRGQLDQALEYYEKSVSLLPEEKNAAVYNNIAMVYESKKEYPKAVEYLKRAIEIDERTGNYHEQARHLLNLGNTYRNMGQFQDAQDALFSGLEKIRKVKDAYWESSAYLYIGWLYSDMGSLSLARKWLKGAVEMYGRIGAAEKAAGARADLQALLKPRPYAGIEIGAKGVKATVLVMTPRADDGYEVNEPYRRSINTTIIAGVKSTGAFEPQSIEDTAKAVKELYDQILANYKVDDRGLFVVGSSAVAKATNRDQLAAKVKELTGKELGYTSMDDEVLYNLIGSIPSDKLQKALSVDIGSGNTKIGYWDKTGNGKVVAVEIPLGTVTLTNAVTKTGDDPKALSSAADRILKDELSPKLRETMANTPGYRNRRPVYLAGGIVWTVATLVKPGNNQDFASLTPTDVDAFITGLQKNPEATLNPSLTHVKNTETRKWAEDQITAVKDVFSPENMLSGAKLLKTVFTEMKIKEAYFARWGSWLAGKVYLQASQVEEMAAKYN